MSNYIKPSGDGLKSFTRAARCCWVMAMLFFGVAIFWTAITDTFPI